MLIAVKHARDLRRGASILALSLGLAGYAQAQTPAPAAPADASQLEEIVVTAQHKPEYEKDVPMAVTSLSNQTVSELSADGEDIRFLAAQVPSLYVESSFGRTYPRFYIRGLGNSDYTYNAQQPVSVVSGDVVLENPILKAFPIWDVQDVEVLRGPQGTLFGRNTPAGVVKIDPVLPKDDYSGYADLSYGTYNTVNFSGAVGGAVVPGKLDFRLSVLDEHRDGWVTNTNPYYLYPEHAKLEGYDDEAARFQLRYTPTSNLDVLFEVDGRALDGTARLFRADIIQKGSNNLVPGFTLDKVNTNGDNYQNMGTWGSHLTVNDDIGDYSLVSVSAYEHGSIRSRGDISGGNFVYAPPIGTNNVTGTAFPDETSDSIPGLDQFTQEFRVQTNGDGPFFNQAGVFYFNEYLHVDDFDYASNGVADIAMAQRQTTESWGIFDSASYKLTKDLTLAAGLRYSNDDKHYGVVCYFTCVAPTPSLIATSGSDVTWDVSATYALTQDMNVYGRVATGYLAPALDGRNVLYDFGNTATAALSQAKAETTISYEIGLKAALLNHKANLNLTAYAYTTDDIQLTAVGGATNSTTLLNADQAIGQGFEMNFEYKPIEPLLLTSSASYNFTQIRDQGLEVSGCGGGCTVLNQLDPRTGNYYINHNPLPDAPRWVIDGSARYTYPWTETKDLYVSTDWSYRSGVDFLLYKAAEFDGPPLLLGGLRAGYIDKTRNFEVSVYSRNILNEVKVTGAIDFDNLTGFTNDPRIVGIDLHYKF